MSEREEFLQSMERLPNTAIKGDTVTIRPKATRPLRLRVNRNGNGYATSYTLPVGCAEAREAGFVDADGNPLPLEKHIDPQQHTITFYLQKN